MEYFCKYFVRKSLNGGYHMEDGFSLLLTHHPCLVEEEQLLGTLRTHALLNEWYLFRKELLVIVAQSELFAKKWEQMLWMSWNPLCDILKTMESNYGIPAPFGTYLPRHRGGKHIFASRNRSHSRRAWQIVGIPRCTYSPVWLESWTWQFVELSIYAPDRQLVRGLIWTWGEHT